ncbi:prolyl oligopeptidase family serine peptidase [Parasediminibacterium sp. JCM 36343]|uniref:prolyl oligopeptidase family serine peptidase n=1 Tax=Parasediminibacterium sp. JCM 36343 TaxID=3374279 RepID=UPI00397AE366
MKKALSIIIANTILFSAGEALAQQKSSNMQLTYPATRKDETVKDTYFGTELADPYRWLENDTSEATKAWVKAENEVTQSYLAKIPFRAAIRKRLKDLWNYERFSAPSKEGEYTYFSRNSGMQNQAVVYRQRGNEEPEVFLDPNTFSAKGTTSLAGMEFTKDGSLAGYQISEGGSDWHKIIVLNALNKQQIGDTMLDIKFSGIAWKGNEGFYYSSYDKPKHGSQLSGKTQEHKLYYHKLGTPQSSDVLVFGGAAQPRRYVGAGITENGRWLVISAANSTYGNELYVQDLTQKDAPIIKLIETMANSHNLMDADDNYFYIETDLNAPNNKVVTAPIDKPQAANWKDFIPETKNVLSTTMAGGYFFCSYLKDAVSQVLQYDNTGAKIREVALPGVGTASGFSAKQKEKELYFSFTSYTYPSTIFKMDIATGKADVFKKPKVLFNPSDYESKQVFYPSKDGTKIPMIITYKKGLKLNGKNPTVLYGYGGFSISLTPAFSTANIVLLENGGVYAVPNLRGGGEYGEDWHNAGIKTKKQNVFDDFIAAAEYLKANKYTSTDYLAIAGGSNGGLLVGATITQRPDLCKVAFPAVGVLDMLRYHKFTAGAGWAYDYGTAEDSKEMFEYLKGYSPLHNIKPGTAYPAILVTTADHDDRVVPAHSFKFAATLQAAQTGNAPVIIRIETQAGHGAGMSTKQVTEGATDKWAFMFYNMGIGVHYK